MKFIVNGLSGKMKIHILSEKFDSVQSPGARPLCGVNASLGTIPMTSRPEIFLIKDLCSKCVKIKGVWDVKTIKEKRVH